MKIDPKLIRGIKAGLPIAVGYFPIAIAFGALAAQAQLSWWEGTTMSVIVYAGASQFVGVSMLLAGAGSIQIITTTLFLNLRHLIMSLAVNDRIRDFPQSWKNVLSFGITDETFALLTLGTNGEDQGYDLTPQFMAGLAGTAYLSWVFGTAAGGIGANLIPGTITTAMTVGLYGLFIGLLIPPVRKSLGYAAVALASMVLNTLLGIFLDTGWAIVLTTVVAAGLGIILVREDS
jgi:4-azaleucine resistance transporter AzlC